ncbi:MAG: PDZ domain-containing protein [Cenarchaeum sp. SB0663_bin_5]|nr:PDZ domain-containing protein [Cenarchaeum sp. SB0663_bin_5]MYH03321.1 PDZ domain-containing protein [Cenarchaeum sp. SB0675_bin_21]MYL11274.1 PDZ domain-containing protein [Cenarchaeum sp. SB0669_bin_11]
MELDFITENAIIYVLLAWVVILGAAKALKLENRGVELKFYSLVYKNKGIQDVLVRMLARTRRGISVFANVSVVAGFLMMGFAFWFLLNNVANFFVQPQSFAELTVLIPGVTLTSSHSIMYFLLSIPIVLVMHEGAHGIVAALEKIRIKTGGFAIFIAMFAGFVEPDEDEFNKAKKISRLRVIGAGATSNVIFALALGLILLTNPLFALVMPEPLLGVFYETPDGVLVLSVIEGSGAEFAGIQANDLITHVNGVRTFTVIDFATLNLAPGDIVPVSVLRDDQPMDFVVEIMESPDEPGRGLIGIMRDTALSYKPVLNFITWDNHQLSMFLLWLWMISFFIGIINMLPLPILDGGKFIHTIIEGRISEQAVTGVMYGVYIFTFILFGLNIALSYLKSGWFTI